jgi:hypothetical protein
MTCSQVLADIAVNKTHRMTVAKIGKLGGQSGLDALAHIVELDLAYVVFDFSAGGYMACLNERQRVAMMRRGLRVSYRIQPPTGPELPAMEDDDAPWLPPQTTAERRQVVAAALKRLRAYRKANSLCRECGDPLEPAYKARCLKCRIKHSDREAVLYRQRILKARRVQN